MTIAVDGGILAKGLRPEPSPVLNTANKRSKVSVTAAWRGRHGGPARRPGRCSVMPSVETLRIIESSEASARLRAAEEWLAARADRGALIVSASRGAADDLARAVARSHGATAGLHRFSFAQLAARLAAPVLAARGIAPAT